MTWRLEGSTAKVLVELVLSSTTFDPNVKRRRVPFAGRGLSKRGDFVPDGYVGNIGTNECQHTSSRCLTRFTDRADRLVLFDLKDSSEHAARILSLRGLVLTLHSFSSQHIPRRRSSRS